MSVTSSVDQAARHLLGSRNHAENADDVSAVSDAKAPGPCRHAILGQSHYAEADKMRLDGTLAELVDNAGDAGATRVDIDCDDAKIIVADNGCGCDAAGIGALGGHRTSTRTDASERFTGKFGQAFTRAVLSLGDTCTVISYQGLVFHVGLLSKKLQIESNTRECLLPVASFRYPSGYEDVVVEVVEDDDGQLWNKGSLIFERLIKANLENILAYGCADTKDALVALANKYRRANGLVIIVSDLDKRVVPCQADKTIYFKQSEGQRSKTRDDVYPYRQDARHALGWQYVVCSGAADQLPEEYKELAVAPRRPTITLCGQELEAVDIAPERRSSGPVVSNGMEVKEIRFDRRKAAAVTIFTHSLDVEAPRRSHEERSTHWPHGLIGLRVGKTARATYPLPVEKVGGNPRVADDLMAGRGALTLFFFQDEEHHSANEEQILVSKDKMDLRLPTDSEAKAHIFFGTHAAQSKAIVTRHEREKKKAEARAAAAAAPPRAPPPPHAPPPPQEPGEAMPAPPPRPPKKRRKRKPAAPPPPPPRPRKRQTPAEKSVAKRVQQAMDLLQTGAMQFADVHGTGASVTFTERDGTFEVEIKRGDDDDATQD